LPKGVSGLFALGASKEGICMSTEQTLIPIHTSSTSTKDAAHLTEGPTSPFKLKLIDDAPELHQLAQLIYGIGLIARGGYCAAQQMILEDSILLSVKTEQVLSEMGYASVPGEDPNFLYRWVEGQEKPTTIIKLSEGSRSIWGVALIGPGPDADNDLNEAIGEASMRIHRGLGITNLQLKYAAPLLLESVLGKIIICATKSFRESRDLCALDSESIHQFLSVLGLDPKSQLLVMPEGGIA